MLLQHHWTASDCHRSPVNASQVGVFGRRGGMGWDDGMVKLEASGLARGRTWEMTKAWQL